MRNYAPSKGMKFRRTVQRPGSQLVETHNDVQNSTINESSNISQYKESMQSQQVLNKRTQNNNSNIVKIFSKRASTNSGFSTTRQPEQRAAANNKKKLPISYLVQNQMKTSNVDANVPPQGTAQIASNVAVEFRISTQKQMRTIDNNARMQVKNQNTEGSASDIGMMPIHSRLNNNKSQQGHLTTAAYRSAMR